MLNGFVLDDQMLKNSRAFGQDYFDELLEKIREIRASERRAYQKIADVFEQCSGDYRSGSEETQLFYQIVQNRLHFARHCPALSTRYPSKSLAILIPSEVGSNEKAFDLPQMFVGRRRPGND